MPNISCFVSVKDLESFFRKGVFVRFLKIEAAYGYLIGVGKKSGSVHENKIIIRADGDFHSDGVCPSNISYLDNQKVTLLHELLHAFHYERGSAYAFRAQLGYRLYETEITCEAFRMVQESPELLEAIIYELSTRWNCHFHYEILDTPFYHFHKSLLEKFLCEIRTSLRIGDVRQARLVRLAENMNVSLNV